MYTTFRSKNNNELGKALCKSGGDEQANKLHAERARWTVASPCNIFGIITILNDFIQ
jgi:hypothetical protein